MTDAYLEINFDNVDLAEAGKLAIDLKTYLLINGALETSIVKENSDTQDYGAVLAIILSSTSVVALVTGLTNWLLKKQNRKITIKKNGEIIGENLSSRDITNILNYLK